MNESIISRIVRAIAETEPENLEVVIENHVSTGAIRDLVNHDSNSWRLQFETPNHVVEVDGNETISVDGEY